MNYTLAELEALETINSGQCDDLKVDTGTCRVWLSRCSVADGEPYANKVTVERLVSGRWECVETYQAR